MQVEDCVGKSPDQRALPVSLCARAVALAPNVVVVIPGEENESNVMAYFIRKTYCNTIAKGSTAPSGQFHSLGHYNSPAAYSTRTLLKTQLTSS
jgi:hypothetical protein